MARNSQGIVDPLDFTSVLEQNKTPGTKITFIVPTDVTGQNDEASVLTLKNQVKEAKRRLAEQGMREAEIATSLKPVTDLLEDSSYWRLQSRSLIVFVAAGFFQAVRLPIELAESLSIDEDFNILPLAPVLASDRKLYILALAKNSVRLFDSTRNVIEELPLEDIPGSFDEVVEERPERVIDVRAGSAGTQGTPSYHGPDGDVDRQMTEEFIYAVGQAVGGRLGKARSQILVLAAVEEYLPIFKEFCPYPAIFDRAIAGNPEHAIAEDLRSNAWQLVNSYEEEKEASELDKAGSLAHGGKGSFDLTEIAEAASQGRVDTLFLPRDTAEIVGEDARTLANSGLLGTLGTGGRVRTLGKIDSEALATFRY